MFEWHNGPDGWGVLWMFFMMAFVWLPILLLILWGFRGFAGPASIATVGPLNTHQPPTESPSNAPEARELARQAYARGDMDRERYLQVIEDLDRTKG